MPSVVPRSALAALLALAAGSVAVAQSPSGPVLARVKGSPTVVRAAPGDNSPETGTLQPGDTVVVVGSEGAEWLTVQPPYGSVSWISHLLVEPQGQPGADGERKPPFNAIVRTDTAAPIRAGAVGKNAPLAVQRTRLPEGTVVQVVGPKVRAKVDGDELETSWYPIIAPADDFRFVRREAVEFTGTAASTGFVVTAGGTSSTPLPATTPTPPAADPPSRRSEGDWTLNLPNAAGTGSGGKRADFPNYHPGFRAAEQARGNGDLKKAEELYRQVADEVSREGPNRDIELANLCYDRIFLMKKDTAGGGGWDDGWQPSVSRSTPLPSATRPAEASPTTRPAAPPSSTHPPPVASLGGTAIPPAERPRLDPPRQDVPRASAQGLLKPTRFKIDGRLVYVLTDNKGYVRHYVTSGGVDLDRYTGRWVEVGGDESRPESLRGEKLVTVTQITAAK